VVDGSGWKMSGCGCCGGYGSYGSYGVERIEAGIPGACAMSGGGGSASTWGWAKPEAHAGCGGCYVGMMAAKGAAAAAAT
jgi:hypothetical protein